jgi:hypothetical protein
VNGADDQQPETTDRFYQGTILRLNAGSRSGTVRTGNGRDIPFTTRDVRILGTAKGFAALREGMRVGFDLGWTSGGVRVTTLRVYEG